MQEAASCSLLITSLKSKQNVIVLFQPQIYHKVMDSVHRTSELVLWRAKDQTIDNKPDPRDIRGLVLTEGLVKATDADILHIKTLNQCDLAE